MPAGSISRTRQSLTSPTLRRLAKTTVIIRDGQTVVIGGLIDETKNRTIYKVPVLGDFPLIGPLFRSNTETGGEKNLYIFLTPHIVENSKEANNIYRDKKGQIDNIKEGVVKMYEGRSRQSEDMRMTDLGYSHLRLSEYDKAMEYYKRAIEINPENPYALLNMGVIYEKLGETDQAIEMYERLISTNSNERAFTSSDPMQTGRKLTDIARKNLKDLLEESSQ